MSGKLTSKQIDAIVLMSATEWAAEEARLATAEKAAYDGYTGVVPRPVAGTPQAVGHGSIIGGFLGQEEWHAARTRQLASRRVRASVEAWRAEPTAEGVRYVYRHATDVVGGDRDGTHAVEIVTHGVDVSGCRTPAEAIATVQAYFAATA